MFSRAQTPQTISTIHQQIDHRPSRVNQIRFIGKRIPPLNPKDIKSFACNRFLGQESPELYFRIWMVEGGVFNEVCLSYGCPRFTD